MNRSFLGRRRRRCRGAGHVLQAYVDDHLHPVEAVAVADHLDACPTCSMEVDDYRLLKRLLGRLRRGVDRGRLARLEATIHQLTGRGAWDR